MKTKTTTITAAEAATNTNIKNQEEKIMKRELFAAETATTENIENQEEKTMKNTNEFNRFMTGLMAIDAELAQTDYDDWGYRDIERRRKNYISRYAMNSHDEQTINWLREHGYMDEIDEDMYTARMEQECKWDGLDELIAYDEQRMAAQRAAETAENDNNEENSTTQEEEDMKEKEELEEKKQEIISSVESWYEGCYDAIYDLTKSVKNTNKYSRNRSTAEARKLEKYWKLMGYSRNDGDERDVDFDTIRNAIIDYLREQPLEYFEDMEDPFNEDSMLDIIDDAYNYADFELPERPDRKEEWLEFVRTCPVDWFDYADDPEQERENLIDMYEDWDDVVFCDFDYAVSGEYSDPYTTMRDDA